MTSLPFSEDAEKALLSCALNGLEAAKPVSARVGVDWFYIPAHQIIYRAVLELVNTNSPVDWVSVLNRLTEAIEEIGGKEYLSSLFGFVPSADSWEYYAAVVLDNYDRRRLILNCREAIRVAEQETAEEAFQALSVKRTEQPADEEVMTSAKDAMIDLCTFLEREEQPGESVPVGVKALEAVIPRFTPGQLVIIGGKRGSCKTALAVSMVSFGIEHARKDSVFFNRDDDAGNIVPPTFDYQSRAANEDTGEEAF